VAGITGATQISAGGIHSCAVVSGGAVKCWGYNGFGELGDGSTSNSYLPVDVLAGT
jgi:alpha-tubulin suppressor-like RCC1 family protein